MRGSIKKKSGAPLSQHASYALKNTIITNSSTPEELNRSEPVQPTKPNPCRGITLGKYVILVIVLKPSNVTIQGQPNPRITRENYVRNVFSYHLLKNSDPSFSWASRRWVMMFVCFKTSITCFPTQKGTTGIANTPLLQTFCFHYCCGLLRTRHARATRH